MFHVEHMKNTFKLLILCLFTINLATSCKKRDSNPELNDEIYNDLKQELEITKAIETNVEKQLEDARKQFNSTPAQSGMYNRNRGKMSDSENTLDLVRQRRKFFEIKLEQRKIEAQQRYLESLTKNGRKWPDPDEVKEYKIRLKLQRDAFAWAEKDKKKEDEKKSSEHKEATTEAGKTKDVPRGTQPESIH